MKSRIANAIKSLSPKIQHEKVQSIKIPTAIQKYKKQDKNSSNIWLLSENCLKIWSDFQFPISSLPMIVEKERK